MVLNVKQKLIKQKRLGITFFETRQEDRIHYENAYITALKATNIETVQIKAWLKSLTSEQLKEILNNLSGNAGIHFDVKLKRWSNYLKEIQILNSIEDKIQHAKSAILQNFKDSFTVQYHKPDGKLNYSKFRGNVECIFEDIQNKNITNNMEADI